MFTLILIYGFLGGIIWAIVTQPAYTRKLKESKTQAEKEIDLRKEILELREKLEAIERKINNEENS